MVSLTVSSPQFGVAGQTPDLAVQRRHGWELILGITRAEPGGGLPAFESWHGEDAAFATDGASGREDRRGLFAFSRFVPPGGPGLARAPDAAQSADIPIITYTLYNDSAYAHLRNRGLYRRAELERLRISGAPDAAIREDRSIPEFPAAAMVLKTAWWPIAAGRLTALPVWDPERNPPHPGGNPYTGWERVVAVDPSSASASPATVRIDFAGRSHPDAHRVALQAFHHLRVDAALAARLMRDRSTRKATLIALGRELEAGDYLVLVSANLASRESHAGVWAAFWWHDRPDAGPFAADRPASLQAEWRNYLLAVAFDTDHPAALDGGPHVCFDPWLEGRFPDGGHGGGTASNCMTCHERASFPPVDFLPVTRGAPNVPSDPAYAPARLRTDFLWSIALHAGP